MTTKASSPSRASALCAVLAATGIFVFIAGFLRMELGWGALERSYLGQPFITSFIALTLLALVLIAVTRQPFGSYGMSFDTFNLRADRGFNSAGIIGSIAGMGFAALGILGLSPFTPGGAMLLAALYLLSLVAVGFFYRRRTPIPEDTSVSRTRLAAFLLLMIAAGGAAVALRPVSDLPIKIIFPLLFIGFGEELLFRGYIQSHLNRAFGKPFKFYGVRFGAGMLIAAALFAVAHPLVAMDLSLWPWAVWVFTAGVTYGYLREMTGSILAPALAHGIPEIVAFVFFGMGNGRG